MDASKIVIHEGLYGLLNKEIFVICAIPHPLQTHKTVQTPVRFLIADFGIVRHPFPVENIVEIDAHDAGVETDTLLF